MAKVQAFTPASVDNLRSGKLGDPRTPGLFIEVDSNGRKIWRYKRRVSGGTAIVKKTLGSYPAHTIAAARSWAEPINLAVERGEDPREAERAMKARDSMTVAVAHGLYLAALDRGDWKTLAARTMFDKRNIWRADIEPFIGTTNLFDIDDDKLWSIVEDKGETSPCRANRLAAELKVFFGWCASRRGKRAGIDLQLDPSRTLVGNHFAENERSRWFSDDEISLFLRAIAVELPLHRRALALLLLTGARKTEVLGARADEVQNGVWTIPAGRVKNGEMHRIPLAMWGRALAQTNAEWLVQQSNARGGGGDGPMMSGWYKVRDRVHARMEEMAGADIEHWTLHDLRRTLRSNTKRLKIDTDTAESMLNHTKKGLVKVYDGYDFYEEKAEGFAKWEAKLAAMARKAGVADRLGIPVTKRITKELA